MIDKNSLFSHKELTIGNSESASHELASMLLEKLRERVDLIARLLEISRELEILGCKYGRIISLNIANSDLAVFIKCQFLFKPSLHPSLYRTIDYPI